MADANVSSSDCAHKVCGRCKASKPISEFCQDRRRGGFTWDCRSCKREAGRRYYESNRAKVLEKHAAYREQTREDAREYQKHYYQARRRETRREREERLGAKACTRCGVEKPHADFPPSKTALDGRKAECRDCTSDRNYRWREENSDRHRAVSREHYHAHRERYAEKHREWIAANPEKYAANKRRSWMKKRSTPKGRLEHAVGAKVRNSVRRGSKFGRRTFEVLGYSAEQLHRHLERHFDPGMTWDNYGEWHIDHRIPLAAFNYQTPDDFDFKRAWALSNLRPMWAAKNRQKSDRLEKPFQPSLAF